MFSVKQGREAGGVCSRREVFIVKWGRERCGVYSKTGTGEGGVYSKTDGRGKVFTVEWVCLRKTGKGEWRCLQQKGEGSTVGREKGNVCSKTGVQ